MKTEPKKKMNLYEKFVIALGLASPCCAAPLNAWDYRRVYCAECGDRIDEYD
jgi:hypothetical protein